MSEIERPAFNPKIFLTPYAGNLKARAEITYYGATLAGFKVIEDGRTRGPWVAMPSSEYEKPQGRRKHFNIVHIEDRDERSEITNAILDEYDKVLESKKSKVKAPSSDPSNADTGAETTAAIPTTDAEPPAPVVVEEAPPAPESDGADEVAPEEADTPTEE